jgi:hypothetical protein
MTDPYGVVLAAIKADTAVAAIASTRVSSEMSSSTPCVVLVDLASTRRPFGPQSGGLGLQAWTGVARCYGPDTPTGAITARQLAGAVSDALADKGRVNGTSGRVLVRTYAPELAGLDRDPDTRLPHYDVSITTYALREAVA